MIHYCSLKQRNGSSNCSPTYMYNTLFTEKILMSAHISLKLLNAGRCYKILNKPSILSSFNKLNNTGACM